MPVPIRPLPPLTAADIARFWKYVDVRGPDECWPWKVWKGHAIMRIGGRKGDSFKSSRIAYVLQHGEDPYPLLVCHTCDNPPCCNGAHLFKGTHKDNSQDMLLKNRGPDQAGESNGNSKLSYSDVVEIRKRYAQGGGSHRSLGRDYSVTHTMSRFIGNFQNWISLESQ